MDATTESWFPTVEELDAYARRRREQRGYEPRPMCPLTVDPTSVVVVLLEDEE